MAELATGADPEVNQNGFGNEFKEHWPLILALFLIQVFAFGFPTFALPYIYSGATAEFGWTKQQAVLLASFKFYTSAAAALGVGRLLDAIHPKYVIIASALLGAVGMAGFLIADQISIYYALGIILGLSAAGLAVSINVTIGRSFNKSTGTMLGIVLTGTSVAGMLLPLIVVPVMVKIGWRPAMAILSCGIWGVALPAWFFLLHRNRPGANWKRSPLSAAKTGMWSHFNHLAATRDFWFIFIGVFLVAAVDQAIVQNQVLFLQSEKGLNLEMVKWGSALLAGVGIGAKTIFGRIFDKFSIAGIAFCYLFLALSIGLSFSVSGIATMLFFMAMMGIAHAGVMVGGPVLLKNRYGVQNLGLNLGLLTLCSSIGFGSFPPLMASAANKSGSYTSAFIFGIGAVLLATVLLFFLKPRPQVAETPEKQK